MGETPDPTIRELLLRHGITDEVPPPQQLTRRMVKNARVILTATRAQRAFVFGLVKTAGVRTFSVREFARALTEETRTASLEDVIERVRECVESRDAVDYEDDLLDPYGALKSEYVRMAGQADVAIDRIRRSIVRNS